MPRKKSQHEVILGFQEAHGDHYDYSKVNYQTSSSKVTVICPVHGEFEITPNHHLKGVGCRKCYSDSQKLTKTEFIRKAKKHFGSRFDYTRVGKFPSDVDKVEIKCMEHDEVFFQEARNHIRGHAGCLKCRSSRLTGNKGRRGQFVTQEELNKDFISRAKEVHGDQYDYGEYIYVNSSILGIIICRKHGKFFQSPGNHLRGTKCPECAIEQQKEGTFKKRCQDLGVDYYRALKRRQAGLSEEKIFTDGYVRSSRETIPLEVFGETYPNLKEATRALNPPADRKTIARWLKDGMAPEEAFERIPNPGYADGIIYLITCKVTDKKYVGLTVQSLERRWKYHVEQAKAGHIKGQESLHQAIREYGESCFDIRQIDTGTTKKGLEAKERRWIKKLKTLVPNGYNISAGGVSGGSHKKPTEVDGIRFESAGKAAEYLAEARGISIAAAKKRISTGRIDVRKPAKPGESLVKSKAYKAWSSIIHVATNPRSKDYISGVTVCELWKDFDVFLSDMGHPPSNDLVLARLDKDKGFNNDNCAWMTKSAASRINAEHMKKTGRLTGRRKNENNH